MVRFSKLVRPRRVLLAGALIASSLAVVPGPGTVAQSERQACEDPTRRVTLYAEQLPDDPETGEIRLGWGFSPDTARIPGPLLEMIEGECMAITVVNDIPASTFEELRTLYGGPTELGVSLHVHGVKYSTESDGTVHTDSYVPPGGIRTYKWYAAPRVSIAGRVVSLGTAGTWWYHDHVIGTDHGTGGLDSGLFGGLVVRRPGDPRPDRSYTVVMGPRATINLRHHPDTDCDFSEPVPSDTCLLAKQGQRIEFVVIGVGNDFHTFHLHGHNWADNRTGFLQHQLDDTALIDAKTIGPSESFGFQVIAGETVGTGPWMLHCHVQSHSDLGMVTFFHVTDPDALPVQPPMLAHH